MKKSIIMMTMAIAAIWATDFSTMSTDKLISMRGNVPIDERPAFQQEMQKRMSSMSPAQRQTYMNSGRGMGMGMGSGMGKNCGTNQPIFSDYDLNNDKKITEKEFQDARSKRMARLAAQGKLLKNAGNGPAFNDIDTSENGTISLDEFQQHQNQQMNSANKYKCIM